VDATRSNPRPESPASCSSRLAGIQDAQILVVQPPPVAGIGNAGGSG